jgi:hypothetical protein
MQKTLVNYLLEIINNFNKKIQIKKNGL